jgi:hypothetical protein
MNLKKFFLCSIIATSFLQPIALHAKEDAPLTKLWTGILTSNVRLVKQALAQGADTSVRFGRYGDTALMTALRIYCHTLATPKNDTKKTIIKTATGFSAAFLTYLVIQALTNNDGGFDLGINASGPSYRFKIGQHNILLPLAISAAFFLASNISFKVASSSAAIVELLIHAEKNAGLRNKEGITALDVLNAYFPYAYLTQDKNWYKFLYLLLKKGS